MTTTEQMSAVGAEQMDQSQEQVSPVAVAPDAAVAAAAERAVAEGFDLSTPEGVRAAAEQFPAFKAVFADYENTGRQKAKNEVRLDEGNLERAQATVRWAAEQIANGHDPEEIAKQIAPHVAANGNWARAETLRTLIRQAKAHDPDAIESLDALAESLTGNADEIEKVANAALTVLQRKSGSTVLQGFLENDSLDDIPVDSKKYKAITDRIAREVEAEMNARQVEAGIPAPIPSASPAGSSTAPMNRQRLDSMTHDEKLAYLTSLPDEERGNMWAVAMSQT